MTDIQPAGSEPPFQPCDKCGSVERTCDHRTVVSSEVFEELLRMLDEPPKVNPSLLKAMQKSKNRIRWIDEA